METFFHQPKFFQSLCYSGSWVLYDCVTWLLQAARKKTLLPKRWLKNINTWDQSWISSALFRPGRKSPELIGDEDLNLWYHPPQPSQSCNTLPTLTPYFGRRLLCWMPKRMWRLEIRCPSCSANMTKGGIHPSVRQVLDLDSYYYLVTDIMQCSNNDCFKRLPSWHPLILRQLNPCHKSRFPVILTQM